MAILWAHIGAIGCIVLMQNFVSAQAIDIPHTCDSNGSGCHASSTRRCQETFHCCSKWEHSYRPPLFLLEYFDNIIIAEQGIDVY